MLNCSLDRIGEADRDALVRLHTDPEVRRYLGGALEPHAADKVASRYIDGTAKGLHWAIRERSGRAFVGLISICAHHDGDDNEVSYQLLPQYWGSGRATEALLAVMRLATEALGYPRLVAETQLANKASRRLLTRVGMRFERSVRRCGEDQAVYGVTLLD